MEGEVVNFTDPVICSTAHKAVKAFEKKFKDETKNNWADRDNFVTKKGKYTMIELDRRTEVDEIDGTIRTVLPVNLDIEQMPLGKLSEKQIDKGFKVLEDIERKLKETEEKLKELSSSFYSTIPHNFGDNPPPIPNQEDIEQKKVYEDYECMLHQTTMDNVNKFYAIYVIKEDGFYDFLRISGRVVEEVRTFKNVLPVNLDIKKMPLGKLSENQIDKGVKVLEEIEDAFAQVQIQTEKLKDLSFRFYSTIPHNSGRKTVPPVINTQEVIDQKKVMVMSLMVISLMVISRSLSLC
ncbi:hypothetical protein NHX12_030975 [Muraenolepis orangiensis]|uniref:Uncharacterized protein n=1 Tax=Muraenolepis orangiensis TaxID=630683 RepID=A0A9Q0EBA2_9TELE|nr:hypothetical protein NHX12_030975 [Muraenolepis orangiensis]